MNIFQDSKVHVMQLSGDQMTEVKLLAHQQPVTCVAFSDDGRYLVACDGARRVVSEACIFLSIVLILELV